MTLGFSRTNLPKHYLQKPVVSNDLSSKFNPSLRRAGEKLKGYKFPLTLATCNFTMKMGLLLKNEY